VVELATAEVDEVAAESISYSDQIKSAFSVNGGDVDGASNLDYVFHFLTFFWKIVFSLIPPPSIMGGWPCFGFSLFSIGVLTMIIGDLATIFGCLINLKATITGEWNGQ